MDVEIPAELQRHREGEVFSLGVPRDVNAYGVRATRPSACLAWRLVQVATPGVRAPCEVAAPGVRG